MSGNLFKIGDKVDGNFELEGATTTIIEPSDMSLEWRIYEDVEVLTLNEILEQVINRSLWHSKMYEKSGMAPFIKIIYETGMWGVIFEIGNYRDMGKQWIVHGVTKGYG